MLLAVAACVLGLSVVLFALYRDEPLAALRPAQPEWDALPTPADIGRSEFRLSYPGYDPAGVETHLDALRRAYTDLYALVPPEVLDRARRRADGGADDLHLEVALARVDPVAEETS